MKISNKVKNWIIGILFAMVCLFSIGYFSAYNATAKSTYVNNSPVYYETVEVRGCTLVVFRYNNSIEVVKL